MVFNNKSFFLDLEGADANSEQKAVKQSVTVAPVKAVTVAPVKAEPSKPDVAKANAKATAKATATPAPTEATDSTESKGPSLTTAEAIAAELAASAAARPPMTVATYAPDALQPGNGLRPQRRRPGANLRGFKSMAASLFKS